MGVDWKTRIGLVLSAIWICFVFLASDEYQRTGQVLGIGFLPLVVIWGVVWAFKGWRAQRPAKVATPVAINTEARIKRRTRIRAAAAVVAVLVLGVFSATWQFHVAGNEAGSNDVAKWFGQWVWGGLVAYAILRAVPKLPPGAPGVLAALIVVGAINFQSYRAIAEEKELLASLAKAAPLINKVQAGRAVTDQEVRDAQIGMLEPLVLAQAAFSREIIEISENYQKQVDLLHPEVMLTPLALASKAARDKTRDKIRLWRLDANEYKSQVSAAVARGKLGVQASLSNVSPKFLRAAAKGFDEAAEQINGHVFLFTSAEEDGATSVIEILNMMDQNAGRYYLSKSTPPGILFEDEFLLAQYRRHVDAVMAAAERGQASRLNLVRMQQDRAATLTNLLQGR